MAVPASWQRVRAGCASGAPSACRPARAPL